MDLLQQMGPKETKFVIRFILKNLKVGANEAIMEMSLAQTFCKNFYSNQKWYEEQAVPVCLKMLHKTPSENEKEDIVTINNTFRAFDFETKVLFFVSYFQQMEEFRRKQKVSSKDVSDEKVTEWVDNIKMIFSQYPFHQNVIETFLLFGSYQTASLTCKLTPGTPCKPMLAKPTRSINEIFSRFDGKKFTCEYKYDGLRGQIHFYQDPITQKQKIEMFSRNLENMTEMYEDLIPPLEKWAKANNLTSFIIDSEIMAFNAETKQILPFQALSTRARTKEGISKKEQVDVKLFIFDVLYLNQENLLLSCFEDRRNKLEKLDWKQTNDQITRANYKDLTNLEEVQLYLDESVNSGCEGLMVKTLDLDATYQPSKRTFKWLKLKKDYLMNQGLGDSFDLVIIGAAWGEGKRTGKFGTFLVASYNDAMDTFESCCKVGTGFSDEDLQLLYDKLKDKVGCSICVNKIGSYEMSRGIQCGPEY
jgi:DNA ligase-1